VSLQGYDVSHFGFKQMSKKPAASSKPVAGFGPVAKPLLRAVPAKVAAKAPSPRFAPPVKAIPTRSASASMRHRKYLSAYKVKAGGRIRGQAVPLEC
jgi:hypothetical protein